MIWGALTGPYIAMFNQLNQTIMINIIDIQDKLSKVYSWRCDGEYDAIVVTAILDEDERTINDFYFGREDDEDAAIEDCVDSNFYGYIPDWCFDDVEAGKTKDVWKYIEEYFD